jgi:hypothetical protein
MKTPIEAALDNYLDAKLSELIERGEELPDAEYVFALPVLKCELALAFLAGAQYGLNAARAESAESHRADQSSSSPKLIRWVGRRSQK